MRKGEEIRIGIVVSEFNYDITMMMLERAKEHAEFLGAKVEKIIKDFNLLKFHKVDIDNVFFPKLMPKLTAKQKRAIELAIQERYYKSPRKTNLRKLAKLMGVSLATFQQHLRAAEEKLIPNLLSYSK